MTIGAHRSIALSTRPVYNALIDKTSSGERLNEAFFDLPRPYHAPEFEYPEIANSPLHPDLKGQYENPLGVRPRVIHIISPKLPEPWNIYLYTLLPFAWQDRFHSSRS